MKRLAYWEINEAKLIYDPIRTYFLKKNEYAFI